MSWIKCSESGSFYHNKSHQVWLWRAVDHATNTPLAYVFGTREHRYWEEFLKLPEPFSIGTVYADNTFAYSSKIPDNQLVTGKKNTQRIERNYLTLRTRIKRLAHKTICSSKDKRFIWLSLVLLSICSSFTGSSILQFYYNTAFACAVIVWRKFLQVHR